MNRIAALAILLLAPAFAIAEDKTDSTPKQFREAMVALREDPTGDKAKTLSKLIITFVTQTPDAMVNGDEPILKWVGDSKHKPTLLAAYIGGNTIGQLDSGVNRDDMYSGVISLFAMYRAIQAADKEFKSAEIDALLKMHKDGKLLAHLVELEKGAAKPKRKEN